MTEALQNNKEEAVEGEKIALEGTIKEITDTDKSNPVGKDSVSPASSSSAVKQNPAAVHPPTGSPAHRSSHHITQSALRALNPVSSRVSMVSAFQELPLPTPLPMIPSPHVSASLNAFSTRLMEYRDVIRSLGFSVEAKDELEFITWCTWCVDKAFDNFVKPYMEDWMNDGQPHYEKRLTADEVCEAAKITFDA